MTKKTKKGKKSTENSSGLIDITQRKFRWSDYLAEKIIKGVAYLSITIVVLIFIFVFRESLPIFKSGKAPAKTEASAEAQETYGEVTDQSNAPDVQETYGEVTDKSNAPDVQETYGEVTDQSADSNVQETYGEVTDKSSQSADSDKSYTVSAGSGFDDNRSALKSLLTKDWVPVSENPRYGIIALIIGTFKITIISILFAAPIAILAALYTASFASRRMKEIIKPTIELLAGFPSVVIGFFCLDGAGFFSAKYVSLRYPPKLVCWRYCDGYCSYPDYFHHYRRCAYRRSENV